MYDSPALNWNDTVQMKGNQKDAYFAKKKSVNMSENILIGIFRYMCYSNIISTFVNNKLDKFFCLSIFPLPGAVFQATLLQQPFNR